MNSQPILGLLGREFGTRVGPLWTIRFGVLAAASSVGSADLPPETEDILRQIGSARDPRGLVPIMYQQIEAARLLDSAGASIPHQYNVAYETCALSVIDDLKTGAYNVSALAESIAPVFESQDEFEDGRDFVRAAFLADIDTRRVPLNPRAWLDELHDWSDRVERGLYANNGLVVSVVGSRAALDSAAVQRDVSELVAALSHLHLYSGGSGLVIRNGDELVTAATGVECRP
jgi:hypothetical protein